MATFPDEHVTLAPLLAVSELARALEFRSGRMGFAVDVQWASYARLRIPGGGLLHLAEGGDAPPDREVGLQGPSRGSGNASGEVVLHVDDCRQVVAALEQRGVEFLGPAAEPAWGGEVRAFGLDPDGHLFEVTSSTGS